VLGIRKKRPLDASAKRERTTRAQQCAKKKKIKKEKCPEIEKKTGALHRQRKKN
jgi:hypothetical protein